MPALSHENVEGVREHDDSGYRSKRGAQSGDARHEKKRDRSRALLRGKEVRA